jgi:hypothetical protein
MKDDEVPIQPGALTRWLILTGLLLIGIGLYFWLAPASQPVIHPPAAEDAQ